MTNVLLINHWALRNCTIQTIGLMGKMGCGPIFCKDFISAHLKKGGKKKNAKGFYMCYMVVFINTMNNMSLYLEKDLEFADRRGHEEG